MFGAALGLVLCSFGPLVAEGSIVFLPEFLPLKYESGFSFTTVNGTCTEVRWVDGEHPACKVADGLEDWPADCATTFSAVTCSVDPQEDSGCVESELTDSGKTWVRVTVQPSGPTAAVIRLPWFKLGAQWFKGVRMMHFKPSSPLMTLHASTALTYAEYRDILTSNIHSDYHDSIVQVGPKEIGDSSWTNKSFSFVLLAAPLDLNSELVASELSILIEKCRTVSACGEISGNRIVSMSLEGDIWEDVELPNLDPTFPEDTGGSGNDASTAVIIGATLGAAVVVGVVIIGIALYRTRRRPSITPLPTEAPPKAAGDESSHFTKTKPNIDVTPTVSGTALPEDDVVDLHKHLTLAHEIGRGAFGKVYLALHTTTGKMYAVKETACPADNQSVIDEIRQEVEIIRPLHHPNLVRYFDLYFNDENSTVGLVLEYMTSGSLQSIIEKFGKISEPLAKTFTRQALLGLNYLHEHQVLHRDIKPGNMLLDHLGTVKLADFGSVRTIATSTTAASTVGVVGTPAFLAPESLMVNKQGRKSDIWSLACSTLNMITAKLPWLYDNKFPSSNALMFHIAGDNLPNWNKETSSPTLNDFLTICLVRDVASRPTGEELLQHAWLEGGTSTSAFVEQHTVTISN